MFQPGSTEVSWNQITPRRWGKLVAEAREHKKMTEDPVYRSRQSAIQNARRQEYENEKHRKSDYGLLQPSRLQDIQ